MHRVRWERSCTHDGFALKLARSLGKMPGMPASSHSFCPPRWKHFSRLKSHNNFSLSRLSCVYILFNASDQKAKKRAREAWSNGTKHIFLIYRLPSAWHSKTLAGSDGCMEFKVCVAWSGDKSRFEKSSPFVKWILWWNSVLLSHW